MGVEIKQVNTAQDIKPYFRYWGKVSKEGGSYHLLPYHCLDVAAIGHMLLTLHKAFRQYLARLAGMEEPVFQTWMIFFLVLHDLGKFSESFQNLRPDLLQQLQQKVSKKTYALRHDSLGYMLWCYHIKECLQSIGIISKSKGSKRRQSIVPVGFDMWARAVTGHHGTPPKDEGLFTDYFNAQDIDAACKFVSDTAHLLLKEHGDLPQANFEMSQSASWWLAGFAVLCDWLGSNTQYFAYKRLEQQPLNLEQYWQHALNNAETAINETELLPAQPAKPKTLQALFAPSLANATPLQACCVDFPIAQGPQLFILEDVTGSGKTDHSSAGAQWIWQRFSHYGKQGELTGQIMALCIASRNPANAKPRRSTATTPVSAAVERSIKIAAWVKNS